MAPDLPRLGPTLGLELSRRAAVPALLLTALAVAGTVSACGSDAAPSSDPSSPAVVPSDVTSGSPESNEPVATNPAVPITAAAKTPLGAGQRAWAAFSNRSLDYDTWWAQLKPLLSKAVQATYVYDDPRNLPDLQLTGKMRVAAKAPEQARYTAEVVVPTDKGTFALDLERHTLTSGWLLYAIKFPHGIS